MFDFGSFSSLGVTSATLALDSKTRTPPGHLRCSGADSKRPWVLRQSMCTFGVSTYVYGAFALYGFMKRWVLFKILCRGAEAFLTFISAIIMYTLILQRCWKRYVNWFSKKRRHVPRCSTAPCCSIVCRMFAHSIIWYLASAIPFFSYDGENKENTFTTCTQDDKTLSIFVLYIYFESLCAPLDSKSFRAVQLCGMESTVNPVSSGTEWAQIASSLGSAQVPGASGFDLAKWNTL